MDQKRPDRVPILGTGIDILTFDEALQSICDLVVSGRFSFTVTPNVDHIMRLRRDRSFQSIYERAELVVPDGVPLIWASRLLDSPLPEPITGPDLVEHLADEAASKGFSVYLLGSSRESTELAAAALLERYPALRVAGCSFLSTGFDEHASQVVASEIAESRADLLFVGLGAPRQEAWIAQFGPSTGARHAVAVGGSFAVISGLMARAPRWVRKLGLEWLWRLLHEPRRLWRRYLVDDLPFLWLIAGEIWRKRVWGRLKPEGRT